MSTWDQRRIQILFDFWSNMNTNIEKNRIFDKYDKIFEYFINK